MSRPTEREDAAYQRETNIVMNDLEPEGDRNSAAPDWFLTTYTPPTTSTCSSRSAAAARSR